MAKRPHGKPKKDRRPPHVLPTTTVTVLPATTSATTPAFWSRLVLRAASSS
jgi:hypothetical protein